MAKRSSRGRKGGRTAGRTRATKRRPARATRARKATTPYGIHEGVSAPARDEVRLGERDFEPA